MAPASLSEQAAARIPSQVKAQRGSAEHLFLTELQLQVGQRFLIVRHRAPRTLGAQRLLEQKAKTLNLATAAITVDHAKLLSAEGRAELLHELSLAQACIVIGGGAHEEAQRLQDALLQHARALPTAFLRFDAESLLRAPATPYGSTIGAHPRGKHQRLNQFLQEKLSHTKHVLVHHTPESNVELELTGESSPAEYSQIGMRAWAYPVGLVSAPVKSISGTLHAPDVFMPDGDLVTGHTPRIFQFHGGALKAVQGEHGVDWMREAMADVPGMRVTSLSFGTDLSAAPESQGAALTRPVAVGRPGCVLNMVDPHLGAVTPTDAPFLGITFCLYSPTLHVQLDGLPVLRDGHYTEAVLKLAGVDY